MITAQQFLVAVVIAAALPQRLDVVDVGAYANVLAALSPALLALALVALTDALAVLHA